MENRHKKISSIVLVCIVGLGLIFYLMKPSQKESTFKDKKEIIPVNLLITCFRATDNSPGVICMRIISRYLMQIKMDREVKKNNKNFKKLEPIKLKVPSDHYWKEHIDFLIFDKEGNDRLINDNMELVFSPEDKEMEIGPEGYHEVVFKVDPSVFSSGDDYIIAKGDLGPYSVVSNKRKVPKIKGSWEEKLKDRASNELILGEFEVLLETAKRIIGINPKSSTGYWYMGLANENFGHYKEALEAYKKAAKNFQYKKDEKEGIAEPPILLYSRIREVKKHLSN